MRKIIKLRKSDFNTKKKDINNIVDINNALSLCLGIKTLLGVPKRKKFRKHIIGITKPETFPVSGKDIRRLECPGKFEIPVNIVDILEKVIEEIKLNRNNFRYRAPENNNQIISDYSLHITLQHLNHFYSIFNDSDYNLEEHPETLKYKEEIEYVKKRMIEFNEKYDYIFNDLFN